MGTEQDTVISRLRQEMKAAPVSVPTVTRPTQAKMVDGYKRITNEQPIRIDMRSAQRRKRIVTGIVVGFLILAAGVLVGLLISARF